jgi:hypothetical protein
LFELTRFAIADPLICQSFGRLDAKGHCRTAATTGNSQSSQRKPLCTGVCLLLFFCFFVFFFFCFFFVFFFFFFLYLFPPFPQQFSIAGALETAPGHKSQPLVECCARCFVQRAACSADAAGLYPYRPHQHPRPGFSHHPTGFFPLLNNSTSVFDQVTWMCDGCDAAVVSSLQQSFVALLDNNGGLQAWAKWLQGIVRSVLGPFQVCVFVC